jgi:hypothetical protein
MSFKTDILNVQNRTRRAEILELVSASFAVAVKTTRGSEIAPGAEIAGYLTCCRAAIAFKARSALKCRLNMDARFLDLPAAALRTLLACRPSRRGAKRKSPCTRDTVAFLGAFALAMFVACGGSRRDLELPEDLVIVVPAAFDGSSGASRALQTECGLQHGLPQEVAELSMGRARAGRKDEAGRRRSLRMKVTRVEGMGGGIYTGRKSLSIAGELYDRGKFVASFRAHHEAPGGIDREGDFGGTCSLLGEVVHLVANDVAKWLANPVDKATLGTIEASARTP